MRDVLHRIGVIIVVLFILFMMTMCTYSIATDNTPSRRERCAQRGGQVVEDTWGHFQNCILPPGSL